jgi:dTDP-4-amino-4,6-dideoxygalactose transaminase
MMHPITEILRNKQFTNSSHEGGKYVQLFEEALTKFLHKPTIVVNSGTSALLTSLWLAGVRAGDEVIIPAYSFVATKNAVEILQAKPVYVDIDLKTYTMKTDEIKITKNTKAIIIVHLYGNVCKMPAVQIPVIEDACQAFGVDGVGKGDYTCYSFYPTKRINTMEGGAVSCKNPDSVRDFRNHGEGGGLNLRMPEINAALGWMQMQNYRPKKIPFKHYDYTLSPPGQCPNADSLV